MAYTAPTGNAVNSNFTTAYTAPTGNVANFNFTDAAAIIALVMYYARMRRN